MKKKNNLKEQREKAMQSRIQKAKENESIREEKKKEQEEKAALPANRKSLAKASGLKSAFIIDNEVIMTSFGKGNHALLEKRIVDADVENLNLKEAFELKENDIQNGKFVIKSQRICSSAVADNPAHFSHENTTGNHAGRDLIGCKDALEKRYFGKTFNDNIHIQLIYNILDIEKILAVHTTNAVFALNNILRADGFEDNDFIGYLSARNTYKDFRDFENNPDFNDGTKKNLRQSNEFFDIIKQGTRLGYFGSAFYHKNGKNIIRKSDQTIYDILVLLGSMRQFCVHDSVKFDSGETRSWIYNAESTLYPEFLDTIDELYNDAVRNIDCDFIETNKVNLQIIYDALKIINGSADWQKITEDYYAFTIEKSHKNIGFSVKKLREIIIKDHAEHLGSDKYSSVRAKLYKIIDFLIYTSYDELTINEGVSILRTCLNDNDKEKLFYKPEAERLYNLYSYILNTCLPQYISGAAIKLLQGNSLEKININIESIKISKRTPDYFSKLIYMLTMFLDGKEINDLLTTLVNKFDNIASFIDVLSELNLECEFTDEYLFFENSDSVCADLRLINSFARMETPVKLAKREMYKEAIEILGTSGLKKEQLEHLLDQVLCIDEKGNYISKKDNPDRDVSLRNFIANNVIENTRFKYLIRYNNAKKTRELASNKTVVEFLLHQINNINLEQINRYYEACRSPEDEIVLSTERKIKYLTEKIVTIDCSQFSHVKNKAKSGPEATEKERLKALVSLYLTIMYILTKNMVYVNSRYITAFHCYERDCVLHGVKNDYLALVKKFINPETCGQYGLAKNKRARTYIEHNISVSNKEFVKLYRNAVAHLNVVTNMKFYINDIRYVNKYFDLYHYVMQKYLFEKKPVNQDSQDFIKRYKDNLDTHNTYCKDFVKALNVPFGYNLVRYKNLSISELFDKNDTDQKRSNKLRNDAIKTDE